MGSPKPFGVTHKQNAGVCATRGVCGVCARSLTL